MCTEMSKQGLAPRTVDKAHTVLSQALSDAVDLGKIAKNPCMHVKLPRAEKREPIILDEEQARRLIQAAREAQSEKRYIGTIVLLLISTGMRIGELLALHWSQIDFEKKELRIAATVSYDQTARILLETGPKSDTSHRTLPLPNLAIEALSAHRLNQIEQRLEATKWVESDLIFANPRTESGHMWDSTVRAHFYAFLIKECDLPAKRANGIVPHDLRHNVATALLAAGVPMKTVSEMPGHSDIKVTVNICGHVTEKMQRAASNEIDRIYGQG